MTIGNFLLSFLSVLNAMSPYLLLGFLIAGVLHVFVPKRFYAKYLSRDNISPRPSGSRTRVPRKGHWV